MRELFDDVAGKSPLDPREASRKSSRTPLRQRFYKATGVIEENGGFTVALDGKPVRTPGRRSLAAPVRALAEAMAAEWDAQTELIDPMTMPLTRLAHSVIDGVADNIPAVADDVAKYFGSDLLFYRAGFPDGLVARQGEHWDPVLRWAAGNHGAHFILTEGVMHVQQPDAAIGAMRALLPEDAWRIAALHVITTITGSALLAVALKESVRTPEQTWVAAHVDEDWNAEKWGADEEVVERRAVRQRAFEAAVRVLKALS